MLSSLWTDVSVLERAAKVAPYVFIVLGFVVALAGQYVRSALNSRVERLKAEAEEARKQTPPKVDAQLVLGTAANPPVVVVKAINDIPFKARWLVVTDRDEVISGVMLQDADFHPVPGRDTWHKPVNLQEDRIRGGFVELRFEWWSVYSAELNHPQALRGNLVRRYKLVNRVLNPLP